MPRLVRHDLAGPIRVEPRDKPIFICACGLTRNFPFCDGSHKACHGEDEGAVYVYDAALRRVVERRADASGAD